MNQYVYSETPASNSFVALPPDGSTVIRYDQFVHKLLKQDTQDMMILHCAMGLAGEVGELIDALKKHIFYMKPLDHENVVEELGDIRFYLQGLCNILAIKEQEILQHNATKLSTRYKNLTYSNQAAIERADKS